MPYKFVHADVCGPISPLAYGEYRYYLLFTCEATKCRHVEFMIRKNEVLENVKALCHRIETQCGYKIQTFRLDNGTEFGGGKLEEYCKEEGITLQYSAPYTPEQNGLAEVSNRILHTLARAMVVDGKLPGYLWPEAVRASVYLLNRSLNSSTGFTTSPIEEYDSRLTGQPPQPVSLANARVYGYNAYIHTPA